MARKVLITAGASGIGLEIARAFFAAGDRVFICDIDVAGLARAEAEMPGVRSAACDVADRGQVATMVAGAVEALGGLDVLVNNAGIGGPTVPVEEYDPEAWDQVLRVNLTGSFDVTRLAIPHLKRSAAGSIIMMSSAAGRFGYANRSAYCATKWALIGLAKTLAMELGEYGIRANAILPGAVEGDRAQRVFEGRAKQSGRSIEDIRAEAMRVTSIKRLVDPRDIAALAVFLASDAAKSISGQMIPIDNDMHKA